MLQIHNNLSRKKEEFIPLDKNNVRMYVCGMTVYDMCHIGHARVLIVFDVIYRYLCELYGKEHVTYVRNITDIDDNIIKRANENKEDYSDLTNRYIDEMHFDSEALGILAPNMEPRATLYMEQIIKMVQVLIDKGFAYVAPGSKDGQGDVYYTVSKFENYGLLSGKKLEDLRAGERVAVDESKNDPLDFVLWKSAKENEPSWPSPWGNGRPGWHIECSAMSTECLGHNFDIHGGGMDLQFPHHENEIAQSEAATGEKFANVWMHNGFVRIDNEKMSKSLGNFFTIREVTAKYDPEVVRYFILTSHYRSPLNYSDVHLEHAKAALTTLYTALRGVEVSALKNKDSEYHQALHTAMNDDFNTPEVLPILFDLAKEVNRYKVKDKLKAQHFASLLMDIAESIGLLNQQPEAFLRGTSQPQNQSISDAAIDDYINQRLTARSEKNWAESDRIRDLLKEQGIVLEDGAGGTSWRRD